MAFNLTNLFTGDGDMSEENMDANVTNIVNGVVVHDNDKELFDEVIAQSESDQTMVENVTESVRSVASKVNASSVEGVDMKAFKRMVENAINESRARWNLTDDYISSLEDSEVVFEVSSIG